MVVNFITIAFVFFIGVMVVAMAWVLEPVLQRLGSALSQVILHLPTLPYVGQAASRTVGFFERYPALNFARQSVVVVVIIAAPAHIS